MRENYKYVYFKSVPPGTTFIEKTYSRVADEQADVYIRDGYGVEYDTAKKEIIDSGPVMPFIDLPEDLPGREQLLNVGISIMDLVIEMDNFDHIPGIGQKTEERLIDYLEEWRKT